MTSADNNDYSISVDRIQIGLYVHLDLGWMDHPFTFNNFKIKDSKEIDEIKKLGLKTVVWEPARSDVEPLPERSETDNESAETLSAKPKTPPAEDGYKRYSDLRNSIKAVEKAYSKTSTESENILKNIKVSPASVVTDAGQLINGMLDSMSNASDLALQMVSGTAIRQTISTHSLNVTVIAIAFAQSMGLSEKQKQLIGTGSLLHDVGLTQLPERFIKNMGPLSSTELAMRKHHCNDGVKLAKSAALPKELLEIIQNHHEYYDGSGYPSGIKGSAIPQAVQIVSLVDFYERLCSPINLREYVTAHDAISLLYRRYKNLFEANLLQSFIRFMGVYPPGSIVSLSDERIAIVIKVFQSSPLRPMLMVYDEDIPKNEAIMLDLRENKSINIKRAINPSVLSTAISNYLSPQERVNYYFDND